MVMDMGTCRKHESGTRATVVVVDFNENFQDGGQPNQNGNETKGQNQIEKGNKKDIMKNQLERFACREMCFSILGVSMAICFAIYLSYDNFYCVSSFRTMKNTTEVVPQVTDLTPNKLEMTVQIWIYLFAVAAVLICFGGTRILLLNALKEDEPQRTKTAFCLWAAASLGLTVVIWIFAFWDWQLFNSGWMPFVTAFGLSVHRLWSIPSAIEYLAQLNQLTSDSIIVKLKRLIIA